MSARQTRERISRLVRFRARNVHDLDEEMLLAEAEKLIAAYPLPPEGGERERRAQWLENIADAAEREAHDGGTHPFPDPALLRAAAALLRQPSPPAAGVSKAEVLSLLDTEIERARRKGWMPTRGGVLILLAELRARFAALPEAAPPEIRNAAGAVREAGDGQ